MKPQDPGNRRPSSRPHSSSSSPSSAGEGRGLPSPAGIPVPDARVDAASRSPDVDHPSLRESCQAVFLTGALSDLGAILGVPPGLPPPPPASAVVVHENWAWANPIDAILHFGGWSHEEAVFDAAVAARFGTLWDIWQTSRDLAVARQRRLETDEICWWRRQGCPVPCPLCGNGGNCGCR